MAVEAGAQVLQNRQEREDPPILGHVADAVPRHAMRRHLRDRPALEQHAAPGRMNEAHDGLERRALADAVAPEQAYHLAGPDLERDTVQDVALAVVGVDVLDLEEGLPERIARAHVLR
jgi:hypothetical protein